MTSPPTLLLESGDLRVCPEHGEIRNVRGESTRLGPVNMRVLELLMSRAGNVVSRAEIFDSVWRNQVVGDDALTRAVSDIRAEINRLSAHAGLIETLPKRGYRWTADVRRSAMTGSAGAVVRAGAAGSEADASVSAEDGAPPATESSPLPARRVFVWAGRTLAYAVALVATASLMVWLMGNLMRPALPVIAVLPVFAEPADAGLAASVEQRLTDSLIRLDRVDLLARSAVESRPVNPFPYFYYEFGARWLIEAGIRRASPVSVLTIDVVDARTGIVIFESAAPIGKPAAPDIAAVDAAVAETIAFIGQQGAR